MLEVLTARIMPCRWFLGGMAIICCAVVIWGIYGVLSLPVVVSPKTALQPVRLLSGCAAIAAGIYGAFVLRSYCRVAWVHICAEGAISLAFEAIAVPHVSFPRMRAQSAHLLAQSTLLPYVMLWRLRLTSGQIVSLPIWPGSVTPEVFRALSLASRQIAGCSLHYVTLVSTQMKYSI